MELFYHLSADCFSVLGKFLGLKEYLKMKEVCRKWYDNFEPFYLETNHLELKWRYDVNDVENILKNIFSENITSIICNFCNLQNQEIIKTLNKLKHIKTINLKGCNTINDEILYYIYNNFPDLQELNVELCKGLSLELIKKCKSKFIIHYTENY